MPENPFKCPKCGGEPNMVITVITEQPSKFYRRLPGSISLSPKKSLNSAMVYWDKVGWVCPECRATGSNISKDCLAWIS